MHQGGVLYVLSQDLPGAEVFTVAVNNKLRKDDGKARPYTFLSIGERPVTLITSLVLCRATAKVLRKMLTSTYPRQNIQYKPNLKTKLHNVSYKEDSDLQNILTELNFFDFCVPNN